MNKQFELVSDLHLDFYSEACTILDSWTAQTEILVIAGDFCELRHLDIRWLEILRNKWPNIIYVPGNHDYYGNNFSPKTLDVMRTFCNVLDREEISVNDIVFAGATLWFPHKRTNLEQYISDFHAIKPTGYTQFHNWVNSEHMRDKWFFQWKAQADVWITHHMPFAQSIAPRWAGHHLNRFFYAQCEDMLSECRKKPKAIVHGHTHDACTYSFLDTPVYCNPMGYPNEIQRYAPYEPRIIEIDT